MASKIGDGVESLAHPMGKHQWPTDDSCVWGPWMAKTAQKGRQKATQWRGCVHPECTLSEEREAPKA